MTAPNCSVFFFFATNVHGSTRYSKNGILDQIDGIYTLFQTRNARKWYPLGRHITIWLIYGSIRPSGGGGGGAGPRVHDPPWVCKCASFQFSIFLFIEIEWKLKTYTGLHGPINGTATTFSGLNRGVLQNTIAPAFVIKPRNFRYQFHDIKNTHT